MIAKGFLVEKYRNSNKSSVDVVNMDSMEMAGYFLATYEKDPIGAINTYRVLGIVPETISTRAEQIVMSLRGDRSVN